MRLKIIYLCKKIERERRKLKRNSSHLNTTKKYWQFFELKNPSVFVLEVLQHLSRNFVLLKNPLTWKNYLWDFKLKTLLNDIKYVCVFAPRQGRTQFHSVLNVWRLLGRREAKTLGKAWIQSGFAESLHFAGLRLNPSNQTNIIYYPWAAKNLLRIIFFH